MDDAGAMTLLTRAGLIGDVHAEDELLELALDYFEKQNIEHVLCTGDVADGVGSVVRCCELLRQYDVQTVRGNHDRWLLTGKMRDLPEATDTHALTADAVKYLTALAPTLTFSSPLGEVLLCHGLGVNDMAKVEPDDSGYALDANLDLQELLSNRAYRFVVNGHTHRAMVRHFAHVTVINAGTLRRHDTPGFLLLDFGQRHVQRLRFANREIVVERVVAMESDPGR